MPRWAWLRCSSRRVAFSVWILTASSEPGSLLSPPLIALLLVANLIPAIALMVLYSRRVARQRAEREGLGSGKLHARLRHAVLDPRRRSDGARRDLRIAPVPERPGVLVLRSCSRHAGEHGCNSRGPPTTMRSSEWRRRRSPMSGDLAGYLRHIPIDDPRFSDAFARLQVLNRNLSEAIIFTYGEDKQIRTLALVNPYDRPLDQLIPQGAIDQLGDQRGPFGQFERPDRRLDEARLRSGHLSLRGAGVRSGVPAADRTRQDSPERLPCAA